MNHLQEKIAVVAGTPVDTQMGTDCLARAGIFNTLPFPVSPEPREQTVFQHSATEEKHRVMLDVLNAAKAQGCGRVFVYCNSLSGAVDFPGLAEETGLRIVTPLDVYRALAGKYRRLGVMAANAQGLAGIERTLLAANPALDFFGAASLSVVLAVEAALAPEELVARYHLPALAAWFVGCEAEALVLGCTHFPYFKEALAQKTTLPLIDPTEEMIALLQR